MARGINCQLLLRVRVRVPLCLQETWLIKPVSKVRNCDHVFGSNMLGFSVGCFLQR